MERKVRRYLAIGLSVIIVALALANGLWAGENPFSAKVADFGQWLSGVAGALALVWLVMGYLQQAEELKLQREELAATREQLALQKNEMQRLANEAEKQSVALQADTKLVERDIAMKFAELVERSVEATAGLIVARIQSHHGRSVRVQTVQGAVTILHLPEDTKGWSVTYLLTQLEKPGEHNAWANVLKDTPEVAQDVTRVCSIVSGFQGTATRANLWDHYEGGDFVRLANLLRNRLAQ